MRIKLLFVLCVLSLLALSGCKVSDILSTVAADLPTAEQIAADGSIIIGSVASSRSVHAPPDTAKLQSRVLVKHP